MKVRSARVCRGVTMESTPSTSAETPPLVLSVNLTKWCQTKKRKSVVERELKTDMTKKMISPLVASGANASKYGRVRKLKCIDSRSESAGRLSKSPKITRNPASPARSTTVYKMNASNSPVKTSAATLDSSDPVRDIMSQNQSLSRFSNETTSPANTNKIYIRKDLIQNREETSENVTKSMFLPNKSLSKPYNASHLNTILQRTAESFGLDEMQSPLKVDNNSSRKSEAQSEGKSNEKKWSTEKKSSEKKWLKKSEKLSRRQLSVMQHPSVMKALFSDEPPEGTATASAASAVPLMKYDPEYEELERSCRFQASDVAWARVGSHPFWPCLVTRDPLTGHIVKKKVVGRGPNSVNVMHVSYLADNGRRGWLHESALRPFSGRAEFEATRDSFTPEQKKKDPRLCGAFLISEKKKIIWENAVKEAEKLYSQPPLTRIDLLYELVYKPGETKDSKVAAAKVINKIKKENKNMSLSESLLGTLFSETPSKINENDKTTVKFDVSDVVTACLDDMATKTGNIKIQKQSHMDRWLQKVKSKTPEKPEGRVKKMVDKSQSKKRHTIDCSELINSAQKIKKVRQPSRYILRTDSSSGIDSEESKRNSIDETHKDYNMVQRLCKDQNIISSHTEEKEKSPDSGIIVNDTAVVNCDELTEENRTSDESDKLDIDFMENSHLENIQEQQQDISSETDTSTKKKFVENVTTSQSCNNPTEVTSLDNSQFSLNFKEHTKDNPSKVVDDKTCDLSLSKTVSEEMKSCFEVCASSNNMKNSAGDSLLKISQQHVIEQEHDSAHFDKKVQYREDKKNVANTVDDDSQNFELVKEPTHLNCMHYKFLYSDKSNKSYSKTLDHQERKTVNSVMHVNKMQSEANQHSKTSVGISAQGKLDHLCTNSEEYLNSDEKTEGTDKSSLKTQKSTENLFMSNIAPVVEIMECDPCEITKNKNLQFIEENEDIVLNVKKSSLNYEKCNIHHLDENTQENMTQCGEIKNNAPLISSFNHNTDLTVVSNFTNYHEEKRVVECNYDVDDINGIPVNADQGITVVAVVHDNSTDIKYSSVNKEGTTVLIEASVDKKLNSHNVGIKINGSDATDSKMNRNLCDNSFSQKEKLFLNKRKHKINADSRIHNIDYYEDKNHKSHINLIKTSSIPENASDSFAEDQIISDSPEIERVSFNCDIVSNDEKKNEQRVETSNKVTEGNEVECLKNNVTAIKNKSINVHQEQNLCGTTSIVNSFSSPSKIKKHSLISEKVSENSDFLFNNPNSDSGVDHLNVIKGNGSMYPKCTNINHENEFVHTIKKSLDDINNTNKRSSKIRHGNTNFSDNLGKITPIYEKKEPSLQNLNFENILQNNDSIGNRNRIINNENKKNLIEVINSPLAMYNINSFNSEEALRIETERISKFMDFLPDIEPDISTPKSSDDSGPEDFEIKDQSKSVTSEKHNLEINLPHCHLKVGESSKIKKGSKECKYFNKNGNDDLNHSMHGFTEILRKRRLNRNNKIERINGNTEPQNPADLKKMIKLQAGEKNISKSLKLDDRDAINTNIPKLSSMKNMKLQNEQQLIVATEKYNASHDNKKERLDEDNNVRERKTRRSAISNSSSKCKINESEETVSPSFEKAVNNTKDCEPDVSFDDETSLESECSSTVEDMKKKTTDKYNDPNFMKYASEKELMIMDENPHLTQDDIQAYLYDMWSFSERKQIDENSEEALVKGSEVIATDQNKKKEPRKRSKAKDTYLVESDITYKEKPIRKRAIKKTYCETDSDSETYDKVKSCQINFEGLEKTSNDLDQMIGDDSSQNMNATDVTDEDLFITELLKPKQNLFKGLVRERLCEICELPGNIVKCIGQCGGMYHIDCVKRQAEPKLELQKRKKKQGRPRKNANEENIDHFKGDSDGSEEKLEKSLTSQAITFDNCEDLESQLANNMKEELEKAQGFDINNYSTDDDLDWDDVSPGTCEIVNIELRLRAEPKIDELSRFKCNDCQKYDVPPCFVCKLIISPKSKSGIRQKCSVMHCHKTYHIDCLSHWPQTQFNSDGVCGLGQEGESITCPRHVCHTCVCDDPRGCKTRFSSDKLARCVRCPAVYHSFTKCLPAGSQIINGSHIICPRHYEHKPGRVPQHVNTSWCFICATGGSLICCEFCPMSFHAACLNIQPPEDGYMCEDCETGRLPLYGEMVWAKLGNYRWWPGLVLHPQLVPHNVRLLRHATGEFAVRFFGGNDHFWLHRGRVFPYQEGDTGRISTQKSKIDAEFAMAVEQAQTTYKLLQERREDAAEQLDIASSLLPPHYVKLRVNRPHAALAARRADPGDESCAAPCGCAPGDPDPCSAYTQCLNRVLLTECGPACRAGERCQNRGFEKRLYPKLAPRRTPQRGWGLHTLQDIRKGQFVIEYVGELIDDAEFRRRMQLKHDVRDENYYFLTLDKDRMIDAGPKGNLARFMNHSCEPNCETQKWTVLGDVRVGLFALCDIPAGSEVTFNYNLECAGVDKKRCMCGARRCAGYIGAKPKQDDPPPKKPRKQKRRRAAAEQPAGPAPAPPPPLPPPPLTRRPRAAHATLKINHTLNVEQNLLNIKSGVRDSPSESRAEVKCEESAAGGGAVGAREDSLHHQPADPGAAGDERVSPDQNELTHEKDGYTVDSDDRDGKIKILIKKNAIKFNDDVANEKILKVSVERSKLGAEVAKSDAVKSVQENAEDLEENNKCQKTEPARELRVSIEHKDILKSLKEVTFDEDSNDDRDSINDNIPLRELIVAVEQKDLHREKRILIHSKIKETKKHYKKYLHPIVSIEQKDLLKEKNSLEHTDSTLEENQATTHENISESAKSTKKSTMKRYASLKEKSKKRKNITKNKEDEERKTQPLKRRKAMGEDAGAAETARRESERRPHSKSAPAQQVRARTASLRPHSKSAPAQSAYEMAFLNFINSSDLTEPAPAEHKRTKKSKSALNKETNRNLR